MVFSKKEEGYNISDVGNWNVASDYAKLKIMQPLDLCDHYENIAKFGYDTILEQLENYNLPLDVLKLEGFKRLVDELLKLINNTMFAMKKTGTKETLRDHKKNLEKIKKFTPVLYKTITSLNKTKILKIHLEKYDKLLDLVLKIKSEINEPLNKNHLIFTDKPDFDPQEYKKKIIEDAKNKG